MNVEDTFEMIRVLHVLGGLNRGGAETMVMNLYRHINKDVIQFDFVVHTDEIQEYTDEIISMGGRIFSCPRYCGKNHVAYCRWWNKFFSEHKEYYIVHGHVRSTAAVYLHIARKYGIFTISHSHSTSSGKGVSACIKNCMQFPIRYVADAFMGCSVEANEWLFGQKVTHSDRCYVLNNAIDVSEYRFNPTVREQIRSQWNVQDQFVIGTVGRVTQPKNHLFLLDVFAQIREQKENIILVIAGDGDMLDQLRVKINQLSLNDSVLLLGSCSDVSRVLQGFDIFLFPSLWEGLGMAAIEAQAAGLPTLCSDRVPEAVAVTDLLKRLPLDDPGAWVSEALSLQDKDWRPDTQETLRKAGYDIRETAAWLFNYYTGIKNAR